MASKQRKAKEKTGEVLKDFLRSTGRMFPETPAQVEAFENRHRKKVKLPDLLSDPIAMLRRGYILQQAETTTTLNEIPTGQSMAARKGLNLSADTLRKMDEDWPRAENQE